MRKYYCDLCSQEFTRHWNMQRHKQMSHWFQRGSSPFMHDTSYRSNSPRPSGFFNNAMNPQITSPDQMADDVWKVVVLKKLVDISSSLSAIQSILLAILNQRNLGTRF
jgi:hypothetical protein